MAKNTYIQLRCTEEFKQKITIAAEKENRSLSNYIINKLEEDNTMGNFNLVKSNIEINYKNRMDIAEGCTLQDDDPVIIKVFDSEEDALRKLQNYQTEVRELSGGAGKYFSVTEYHIENEDGEVLEFSKMNIEVCKRQSYEAVGTYNNYKDAENALDELEDGFISFKWEYNAS